MDTLSSEVALAEISKSVDVTQGDTVSLTFQLRFSADDQIDGVSLLNIGSFQDANGAEIETALDSINQASTEWQTINMRYPIPQDAVKLFFGVRIAGVHESVYVLVDDFSVSIDPLLNQLPSAFSLLAPANGSVLPSVEEIEISWGIANDMDGDQITYDLKIWTDAVLSLIHI